MLAPKVKCHVFSELKYLIFIFPNIYGCEMSRPPWAREVQFIADPVTKGETAEGGANGKANRRAASSCVRVSALFDLLPCEY
jgi:hypothetical protein